MIKLLFATSNKNKLKEIQSLLGDRFHLVSLADINFTEEIPEDQDTIAGNAIQKVKFIADSIDFDCFADDTGLEVNALNGEPGIFSARYAGEVKDANANMDKLLFNLSDKNDKTAQFTTVIALLFRGNLFQFEGVLKGRIISEKRGEQGFGYDPIFVPDGYDKTLAEMSLTEKNEISHRALAVKKLVEFLKAEE